MKKSCFLLLILISFTFNSCGQTKTETKKQTNSTNSKNQNKMDLSKLTNDTVKQAIEALQHGNKAAWYGFFTSDAIFTDDGNKLDFKSFFDNAFNHKEKFLTLDKIENDGKNITGDFFAGHWGTFKVFFNFHINAEGKIERLDIGQTK